MSAERTADAEWNLEQAVRHRELPYEGTEYEDRIMRHKEVKNASEINLGLLEKDLEDGIAYQIGRLTERTGYILNPEGPGIWELTRLVRLFL